MRAISRRRRSSWWPARPSASSSAPAPRPPGTQNDLPNAERDNYFDVGAEPEARPASTLGVDAYYKKAKNLIDEGQFGAPIILTPFNYRDGIRQGRRAQRQLRQRAASAPTPTSPTQKAQGQGHRLQPVQLRPRRPGLHPEPLHLPRPRPDLHGLGRRLLPGSHGTRSRRDLIYGSGLRKDGDVPNGDHVPGYTQVNLSVAQELRRLAGGPLDRARRPHQPVRRGLRDPRRHRRRRRRAAVRPAPGRVLRRQQELLIGSLPMIRTAALAVLALGAMTAPAFAFGTSRSPRPRGVALSATSASCRA